MNIKRFYLYHFSWKITLFALILAAVMLVAAKWQWTRYHEKNILVSHLKENTSKDTEEIHALDLNNVSPYTKIQAVGTFLNEHSYIVINRRHRLGTGSWLLTPFKVEGMDQHILVSRGFIPFEDREPVDFSKYNVEGQKTILGVVQSSIGKRSALSPSAETVKKHQWLYPDLALISKTFPFDLNTSVFIQQLDPAVYGEFPAEDISIDVPPSTHFWYTFEWIALAFFTCLISFLIQLFRPRKPMGNEKNTANLLLLLFILSSVINLLPTPVFGIEDPSDISQRAGIIERSGNYVDLDIELVDEEGKKLTLRQMLEEKKPLIIAPVYFECPRLCTLTQEGLLKTILESDLKIGHDYTVASISFNHKETAEQAKERSKAYRNSLIERDDLQPSGWKFMVGDEGNIQKLMKEIGFGYEYDNGEYMHAAGIIMISPEGLIARYLYGIEFKKRDFRLGLVETAEGKIGSFINQAMMFCFRYDHLTGQYTLAIWNIIRIICVLFVIILIGFLSYMRVKEVTKNNLSKYEKDL